MKFKIGDKVRLNGSDDIRIINRILKSRSYSYELCGEPGIFYGTDQLTLVEEPEKATT